MILTYALQEQKVHGCQLSFSSKKHRNLCFYFLLEHPEFKDSSTIAKFLYYDLDILFLLKLTFILLLQKTCQ